MTHETVDIINTFFEGGGSILVWLNVRRLRRDQQIKGVSWLVQSFWAVWGIWNCAYYGAVGHPLSQMAGAVLALGNLTWVAHAIYYVRNPPSVPVKASAEEILQAHVEQHMKYWKQEHEH